MADARLHHCPCASACRRGKRGQATQALGRSRGGFTTKIHAACDARGYPLRFLLTGGQAADCQQALALLEGHTTGAVLADKGYDADYIIAAVQDLGAIAVIPPKANRKMSREDDVALYKERNLVERMFNKLKHFRRVATRYDKLASSFMGWLTLAGIILWLK